MANLVLANHPKVTREDVVSALSQRLSNKYDVHVMTTMYASHVIVSKAAWMGILVGVRHGQSQTIFQLGYTISSGLLLMLLVILVVPALAIIPLSRSRSRRELEANVIDAIKDTWPEVTSYFGSMRGLSRPS